MRRNSRALALLLSAAMIGSSISVPVLGAEDMPGEELAEEIVEAQEEAEAQGTADEQTDEEAPETPAEEDIEGQIGDPAKGDTYIVARNYDEMAAAIENAAPGKVTVIDLSSHTNKLENDGDFTISTNAAPIEISGKTIILYVFDDLAFDAGEIAKLDSGENAGKYDKYPTAKIKVDSGAALQMYGDGNVWFNIENEGEFAVWNESGTLNFRSYNGTVIDNKGDAVFEGGTIYGYNCDQAVLNEGSMTIDASKNIIGAKNGEKTTENYAIVNKKDLIIEHTDTVKAVYTEGENIAPGYAILNDADGNLSIRGGAEGIDDIYNKGILEVGEENYYEKYDDTNVGTVYSVEEGSVVLHDAWIGTVRMGANKLDKKVKSGTFTQVDGTVGSILFTDSTVLPILRRGTVNGLRKQVEKDGKLTVDDKENYKDYKYIGHRIDETDVLEREIYRAYDQTKDTGYDVEISDSEKYVIADRIVNGIPYRNDKAMFEIDLLPARQDVQTAYKPIATQEDLAKAAASEEGGYYYLVNDGDYAGTDFVIDKEIKFTTPYFRLASSYLYDEEKHLVSQNSSTIKDGGSLNIAADSVVSIGTGAIVSETTGTAIVNEGNFTIGSINAQKAKKNVLENKAVADVYSIRANACEDVLVVNTAEGTLEITNLRDNASKKTDIVNEGKMNIDGTVDQNPFFDTDKGESLKGLTIIENKGELEVESTAVISQFVENGIAVDNTGTLNIQGVLSGLAKGTTVVKNNGSSAALNMVGGSIFAYNYDAASDVDKKNAYAIVYTDNEPVLSGGTVYGSRGTVTQDIRVYKEDGTLDADADGNEKLEKAVYGSAVVKEGDLENPGEYKTSEAAPALSGKNAGLIEDGIVPCATDVRVSNVYTDQGNIMASRCDYLLMEVGESIPVSTANPLGEYAVFTLSINKNTFGVKPETLFEVTSTTDAVKIESTTAADFDKEKYSGDEVKGIKLDVIKAAAGGMATVKAKSTITGSEDYIVVEVVKAGEREKIVASSYEAKLATENITMNAYQKKITLDVDWHLADYDNVTGSYKMANNFYPVEFDMADSYLDLENDLWKYFYPGKFYRDGATKTYKIDLESRLAPSSDGRNQMPYLVQDDMTKLTDINLVLEVKDVVSGKTLEVPIKQKLNISVKQQKPVVKFAKESVNSAYLPGMTPAGFYPTLTSKSSQFAPFAGVTFNGDVHYFEHNGGKIEYTGPAKGGSFKIPVYVTLQDYYGVYDSEIAVSARAAWPKASLDKKSVTVPVKYSDYENIELNINTANPVDMTYISDVYIDGDSAFRIVNKGVGMNGYRIQPKPWEEVKGSQKVTLKVFYDGSLKKNKGKAYVSTLNLTVKTLPNGKFKLGNAQVDNPVYASFIEATETVSGQVITNLGTNVSWSPIPDDVYCSDTYYVVKATNGKLLVSDDDGIDNNTGNDDHNGVATYDTDVFVQAGPDLTASDKQASIQVDWYASDGTKMSAKPLVINVPINTDTGSVNDLKDVTIDIAKQNYLTKTELAKLSGSFWTDMGTGNANSFNIPAAKLGDIVGIDNWLNVFAYGSTALKLTNGMRLSGVDYHGNGQLFRVFQTDKKLYVIASNAALKAGKVAPGGSYKLDVRFVSPNGGIVVKTLNVKVNPIKKVKATGTALDDMSALTSYARARIAVNTQAPMYGLAVKEARLTGSSASMFDLTAYSIETASNVYTDAELMALVNDIDGAGNVVPQSYMLTWKDNTVPSGAKNGTMKVTMEIEYTCGAVAKVTVPVNVFGAGVK